MAHNNHDKNAQTHGHHPLVPIRVYILTLLALLVLTVLTVGASYMDFGKYSIVVNIGIATVKASLVMAFFMGLKYDNNLNRSFILSSFAALTVMIVITASDLWVRPTPHPVMVKQAKSLVTKENLAKFEAGSPELVATGKKLFDTNCAVCHGATGHGDGAGGAALNPKPRNFTADAGAWTFGNSAKSIYHTLYTGSPGTGMASYKSLLPEDRWALTHYVMSLGSSNKVGKADAKGDADIEAELASAGGPPKPSLPIDLAIDRVAQ
jgi:caa(3)-type oxidase subunit IV